MGTTLARAHQAVGDNTEGMAPQFHWPWPWAEACLSDLAMPEKVRSAARQVLDAARDITTATALTVGVVHGDPNADAFRLHGETPQHDGLIDWSAAMQAPVLYDLGCFAVMTWDVPEARGHFIDGYLEHSPQLAGEMKHLNVFVRLRWMCNAIYFSARIARGIVRGAESMEHNEEGLATAYEGMTS